MELEVQFRATYMHAQKRMYTNIHTHTKLRYNNTASEADTWLKDYHIITLKKEGKANFHAVRHTEREYGLINLSIWNLLQSISRQTPVIKKIRKRQNSEQQQKRSYVCVFVNKNILLYIYIYSRTQTQQKKVKQQKAHISCELLKQNIQQQKKRGKGGRRRKN